MRTQTLLILTLLAARLPNAAKPAVTKVEPPDWWVGHSINPVRLLLRGTGLTGAALSAPDGLRISHLRVNAAGTYLFADLSIPLNQKPGDYSLTLQTPAGVASVPYHLNPPLSEAGRLPGFTSRDVVYLLMPDRFANGDPSNDDPAISRGLFDRTNPRFYHGGDLQGAIDHLPYLKQLGVTAIWMTPLYDNDNHLSPKRSANDPGMTDYHGYGAVDTYAVDEHFGTLLTLRQLVQEAHQLGIKVIQDEVENHVGPHHPWVSDPPTPTWFHGTPSQHLDENWLVWSLPDPSASDAIRRRVLDGWFGNVLPDLNQDDRELRTYEIQNTLWWIGTAGFDAIRQDTWPYVPLGFWCEWMTAIKRQFPTVNVVGEVLDGDPVTVSFFQGGRIHDGIDTHLDSLFDYPLYFKMRDVFGAGKPLVEVPKMLAHDDLYPNAPLLWTFLGDHDEPRLMNYDTSTLLGAKLAYTCLFSLRGVPLIYYGDEIAMRGGEDPDNRRDFPGGWPGDTRNAFTAAGRTPEQQELFEHISKLAHLRASVAALSAGAAVNLLVQQQQWAFAKRATNSAVIVVLNNAAQPAKLSIPLREAALSDGSWKGLLGAVPRAQAENGTLDVLLPARSGEIFTAESQ